jgi:phospholipase C
VQALALDITIAPPSSAAVSAQNIDPASEPALTAQQKLELIRRHVKYVFVLFQENRSFDFYFGSYPGADGLYAGPGGLRKPADVPGFTQAIVNTDGSLGTISAFKIPATITDANGKAVPSLSGGYCVGEPRARGNRAQDRARRKRRGAEHRIRAHRRRRDHENDGKPSKAPTLERKQFGELVMAHVDCDTAPFLWRYADRFTLFDHFMDTIVGPSTPNAIAMISGQGGETQWMLHPDADATGGQGKGATVPMLSDPQPYWGSPLDTADKLKQPQAVKPFGGVSKNLTFASLPLSFMGSDIKHHHGRGLRPRLRSARCRRRHRQDRRPQRQSHPTGAGISRATTMR